MAGVVLCGPWSADFVAGADLEVQILWQVHFVALGVQISWQAQDFVDLEVQISWQVQVFVDVEVQSWWPVQDFVGLGVQISWQAQDFVDLGSVDLVAGAGLCGCLECRK